MFNERFLQGLELPVQQVARHLDQTQNDVGADGWVGVFNAFPEGVVVRARDAVEPAEALGVGMLRCPFGQAARAQEIALIVQEFLQGGAMTPQNRFGHTTVPGPPSPRARVEEVGLHQTEFQRKVR
ncbi:MAG: hypothetical protein ACYDH9_17360 [Limisphaerales bacterium]